MNFLADQTVSTPADMLRQKAQNALSNALDAERKGLRTYESLKNVGEDIGTEYGDRVLFELIQNAHDAHADDDDGGIAIKLVTTSKTDGRLIVANRGCGFRDDDVEAIINLATSGKEIGEGIGNKGLGFRSIETISDDVHIYSRSPTGSSGSFDGYCFASRGRTRSMTSCCRSWLAKALQMGKRTGFPNQFHDIWFRSHWMIFLQRSNAMQFSVMPP